MKKTHIIALILIALSIGVIISMVSESSTYEDFETAKAYPGQQFYVVGQLVEDKPIQYNPKENPNYFSFFMKDQEGEVRKVVFNGAKPQDFERSEQIVLVGAIEDQVFQASKILLKCPSKYKETEVIQTKTKAEL